MQKTINHPELGEIVVLQTARARRISVRILSSARVRVSFPLFVSPKEALAFLESKKEWVLSTLEKIKATQSPPISMPFATRTRTLYLDPKPTDKFAIKIDATQIIVSYPLEMNYTQPEVQTVIKKAIEETWRIEAKQLLPPRIKLLAQHFGFKLGAISIRNTKSRWGSCSGKDNISLSLRLMRLPDHLIDYILLHELCHTVHKDHSANFYALLDKVCAGKHKALNKELKDFPKE